jgi:hypothetical protein
MPEALPPERRPFAQPIPRERTDGALSDFQRTFPCFDEVSTNHRPRRTPPEHLPALLNPVAPSSTPHDRSLHRVSHRPGGRTPTCRIARCWGDGTLRKCARPIGVVGSAKGLGGFQLTDPTVGRGDRRGVVSSRASPAGSSTDALIGQTRAGQFELAEHAFRQDRPQG